MSDLYRLVYTSKNLLQGPDAETTVAVTQILATSQRNNSAVDVTGALMFNGGAFAQVLEGPRRSVEQTFERIQRDWRHGDVTVLQCGPVEERGFADWSMAFVGHSAQGQTLWSGLAAESGFDLSRLDGDAVFAMLHGLVLEEEGVPVPAAIPAPAALPDDRRVIGLDVARIRTEIEEIRPDLAATDAPEVMALPELVSLPEAVASPEVVAASAPATEAGEPAPAIRTAPPQGAVEAALTVLKASLASERQRTTALCGEIDALQVALAMERDRHDALRSERDLWAERARLLATALCDDAEAIRGTRAEAPERAQAAQAQASGGTRSKPVRKAVA